jgi:hypothetical protein
MLFAFIVIPEISADKFWCINAMLAKPEAVRLA